MAAHSLECGQNSLCYHAKTGCGNTPVWRKNIHHKNHLWRIERAAGGRFSGNSQRVSGVCYHDSKHYRNGESHQRRSVEIHDTPQKKKLSTLFVKNSRPSLVVLLRTIRPKLMKHIASIIAAMKMHHSPLQTSK